MSGTVYSVPEVPGCCISVCSPLYSATFGRPSIPSSPPVPTRVYDLILSTDQLIQEVEAAIANSQQRKEEASRIAASRTAEAVAKAEIEAAARQAAILADSAARRAELQRSSSMSATSPSSVYSSPSASPPAASSYLPKYTSPSPSVSPSSKSTVEENKSPYGSFTSTSSSTSSSKYYVPSSSYLYPPVGSISSPSSSSSSSSDAAAAAAAAAAALSSVSEQTEVLYPTVEPINNKPSSQSAVSTSSPQKPNKPATTTPKSTSSTSSHDAYSFTKQMQSYSSAPTQKPKSGLYSTSPSYLYPSASPTTASLTSTSPSNSVKPAVPSPMKDPAIEEINMYSQTPKLLLDDPSRFSLYKQLRSSGWTAPVAVASVEMTSDPKAVNVFAQGFKVFLPRYAQVVDYFTAKKAVFLRKGNFSTADVLLKNFITVNAAVSGKLSKEDVFFIAQLDERGIPAGALPKDAQNFAALLEMGFDKKEVKNLFWSIGPDAAFSQLCGL